MKIRKFRKIIVVFLSVLILCTAIFSVPASAIERYSDGFYYECINDSSEAEIVDIKLDSYKVYYNYCPVESKILLIEIPSTVDWYTVTSVAKDALIDCSCYSVELVLPDTISVIESETFYNNYANANYISGYNTSYIKRVYIPPTVTTIEENAFASHDLTIYGEKDSVAYEYATENNIPFVEFYQGENSTTELNYWIDNAEQKIKEYEMKYAFNRLYYECLDRYENSIYVRDSFFSTQNDIDTATYNLEVAYKCLELQETIDYVKVYNPPCSYMYTYDSQYQLDMAISSAESLLSYCATPTELDNAISNINYYYDALVLQSECDLKRLIEFYNSGSYYYNSRYGFYSLGQICTFTTGSQLYSAICSAESVLQNFELEDDYYKHQVYLDEIFKIIDAQDNLELASYYTLKENIAELQKKLDDDGYKYYSFSVDGAKNGIMNADYTLHNYENEILYSTKLSYLEYGYREFYSEVYNRNLKLFELNDELFRMNYLVTYGYDCDYGYGYGYGYGYETQEKFPYLTPIELGDVDMSFLGYDREHCVDVTDVVYVLQNVVGAKTFDERQQYAGDMNEDGTISLHDAILVQKKVLSI